MKLNKKTRFYNFTIELLIMIVFFVIASIICVMLFANALQLKDKTIMKNNALLKAQSLVEMYRNCEGIDAIKAAKYIEDAYVMNVSVTNITEGLSNMLYEFIVVVADSDGNELANLSSSCLMEVDNEK